MISIPKEIVELSAIFKANNHELLIVGGAVRDFILGVTPKDWDCCTDATPDQMISMLIPNHIKVIPTGIKHGTITFMINGSSIECTTFRRDVSTDGRHAEVEFTTSIEIDSNRRDLTINSLYMNINTGDIIDFHGGKDDIMNSIIRFVGDPDERVKEDYLRILRYFRFGSKFPSSVIYDDASTEACVNNLDGLRGISKERIWSEIKSILKSGNRSMIFYFMEQCAVFRSIDINLSARKDNNESVLGYFAKCLNMQLDLREVLKASNDEVEHIEFVIYHINDKLDKCIIEDMLVNGTPKEFVRDLCRISNRGFEYIIDTWEIPTFPVTGGDLLSKGFTQGILIGQTLEKLRNLWKMSRFQATKNELLTFL